MAHLAIATAIIDDDRRVVVVNDAARALLGVDVGACVALPTRESADGARTDQRHVLGMGGEPFLASVGWRAIELDTGPHTLVHIMPITGASRTTVLEERDLEVLRHGVAIAELGLFEHDHLTDAIWVSPEMRAIYGWPAEKPATLLALLECAHPEDGARVGAAVARAHDPNGDGFCDVEGRLFRPDREVRWVRTRSRTYFDGEGAARRPSRTIGAIVDLTAQKRLAQARSRLVSVLDETPDLVAIVDATGRIEYANPAVRSFFDITEPIETVDSATLLGPTKPLVDKIPEALEHGRAAAEVELTDGRSLSIVLLVHRDRAGGVSHYSAIGRDTTALRNLEQQLRQSQKMEAVGQLAGGIAHDFNNLLSVILSYVELMLEDLPPTHPSRPDLQEIDASAKRAAELTQQLLAFSRRQVLRPRSIDPSQVVAGLEPILRRIVGEDVDIACHLTRASGTIQADPIQLEQVLLNLVINARDALPEGGRITLETAMVDLDADYVAKHQNARMGQHVMLAVTDDGVGMDAATIERIFEPFFTTKALGRGTGLGLSTVYGIVRQSGGTIWVYSELGRGTTFKIYFPVVTAEAQERPSSPPALVTRSARILLVEDEPAVRRVVAQLLQRAGHVVTEAAGPQEALASGAEGIHLLLTDVVMPKMTGRQLADALTSKHPALRVLYMSGYTENSVVHHGVLEPGIHFLPKPIVPATLLAAVAAALGESHEKSDRAVS